MLHNITAKYTEAQMNEDNLKDYVNVYLVMACAIKNLL